MFAALVLKIVLKCKTYIALGRKLALHKKSFT